MININVALLQWLIKCLIQKNTPLVDKTTTGGIVKNETISVKNSRRITQTN